MTPTTRRGSRYDFGGVDDGYDWLDKADEIGWTNIGSWGVDGWDLGGWPLVAFSWQQSEGGLWNVVDYCEGDLFFLLGATETERDHWLDCQATFHWHNGQSYVGDLKDTVRDALRQHLADAHGVDPAEHYWDHWQQHAELHAPRDVDAAGEWSARYFEVQWLGALIDDWLPEQYRGPYSNARCDAYHATEGATT